MWENIQLLVFACMMFVELYKEQDVITNMAGRQSARTVTIYSRYRLD